MLDTFYRLSIKQSVSFKTNKFMKKQRKFHDRFRSRKKFTRVMKLTSFLIFAFIISANAAVYSQATSLNLVLNSGTLIDAFKQIEDQSGFYFYFNKEDIGQVQGISANIKGKKIQEVLDQLLEHTNLEYKMIDRYIVVKKKDNSPFPSAFSQTKPVTGTVTDSNGQPLPGVTVVLKGTAQGTVTGDHGQYTLSDVPPGGILIFSFIGMRTKELEVGGASRIDVSMDEESVGIEEVVAIGYGTQKRKDLTSSIATVSKEDIANQTVPNATSALQGKMAGVQITNDGAPDSSPSIRIRGTGSIYSANPLYVVDGMIVDNIDYLGPDDIDNISVLKDASASAIYGVRAANGVIMVTTKKGTKDGRMNVFFNSYAGIKKASDMVKKANGEQYVTLYNEKMEYLGYPEQTVNYSDFNTSTDWYDEVLQTTVTNYEDISIQGGTDRASYNVGVNHLKNDGLIRKNNYERIGLRMNYDFKINDHLRTGMNIVFNTVKTKAYPGDLLLQCYKALPVFSPTNEDGSFVDPTSLDYISVGEASNPAATLYYNHQWNNVMNAMANFYIDVNLLKYFNFRSTFGFNPSQDKYISYTPVYDVSSFQANTTNNMTKSRTEDTNKSWDNMLTFEKMFNHGHNLKVMLGYTYRVQTTDYLYGYASGLEGLPEINQSYLFLSLSETDDYASTASDDGSKEVQIGYMGRINYDYKSKYLANLTMRADGSSKFPKSNRWGYFPSVGLGWIISEEPFMKKYTAIDFFKLRASWGLLGNDNVPSNIYVPEIDDSNYRSVIFGSSQNSGDGSLSHAATITSSYNPDLKWEVVNETNIGLDLITMKKRLSATIDCYYKLTTNAIFAATALGSSGIDASGVWGNYADILNKGIELTLGWSDKKNDFSYAINVNGAFNKNKVKKINAAGASYYDGSYDDTPTITRTTTGHSVGEFFGYHAIGVFQNEEEIADKPHLSGVIPGDLIFEDVNGDEEIDADDRTFLGNPNPSFTFGINLNMSYKNFDFSIFGQGVSGNKIFNANRMLRYQTENFDEDFYKHRWHGEGTSNRYPSAVMSNPTTPNSFYVETGNYIRVKNIQLGYNLPAMFIRQIGIQKTRFYLNAENPLTVFKYHGFSPEVSSTNPLMSGADRNVYPLSSIYSIGVNVTF